MTGGRASAGLDAPLHGGAAQIPRFLVTAVASGSGKTTVTAGLLCCLKRRGVKVSAFKCGPDYIDPMFHRSVLGTPCRNIDLFFSSEDETRSLIARGFAADGADIAVLEGVMGFYDGLGGRSTQASAYHVAHSTGTPVVAVVDGRGTSLTLASVVSGLQSFRQGSNICGVIINRCSKGMFEVFKEILERECGVVALGYLPQDETFALESRHLGLVTALEVEDLQTRIGHAADVLDESLDFDALFELAASAEEMGCEPYAIAPEIDPSERVTIAVAKDEAFCFYYEESLDMLGRLGARIVEFSPLRDVSLPKSACAVYLGGGYPELHARELSENKAMMESLRAAYGAGMPIFAECGGFLYLKEMLSDLQGRAWPMLGVLPGTAEYTGQLKRFGYVELCAKRDGLGFKTGDKVPAHEFHYYDSDDNGDAFKALKPVGGKSWDCGILTQTLFAGFPHLYLPACERFARSFVRAALKFRRQRF